MPADHIASTTLTVLEAVLLTPRLSLTFTLTVCVPTVRIVGSVSGITAFAYAPSSRHSMDSMSSSGSYETARRKSSHARHQANRFG